MKETLEAKYRRLGDHFFEHAMVCSAGCFRHSCEAMTPDDCTCVADGDYGPQENPVLMCAEGVSRWFPFKNAEKRRNVEKAAQRGSDREEAGGAHKRRQGKREG